MTRRLAEERAVGDAKAPKFDGNISIEYERDWENTVPDIAQCVGYVRGFADAENKP